jgi:hypothetical protein
LSAGFRINLAFSPRVGGYAPDQIMTIAQAQTCHSAQIKIFDNPMSLTSIQPSHSAPVASARDFGYTGGRWIRVESGLRGEEQPWFFGIGLR